MKLSVTYSAYIVLALALVSAPHSTRAAPVAVELVPRVFNSEVVVAPELAKRSAIVPRRMRQEFVKRQDDADQAALSAIVEALQTAESSLDSTTIATVVDDSSADDSTEATSTDDDSADDSTDDSDDADEEEDDDDSADDSDAEDDSADDSDAEDDSADVDDDSADDADDSDEEQ